MIFGELVRSVRSSAANLELRPAPLDYNRFVASACYDRPYEEVLAMEAAGSLPPLVLPPPYLDVACDEYGLDLLQVQAAFLVRDYSAKLDWDAPSKSSKCEAIDDASLEEILRKLSRCGYQALNLGEGYFLTAGLVERGRRGEALQVIEDAPPLSLRAYMASAMCEKYDSETPHWMHWKKKAFQDGDGLAGVDVALYHYRRNRLDHALHYAVSSANFGDHNAACLVGWMYQHGECVGVDLLEAARWYGYAASIECESIPVDMPMEDELPCKDGKWADRRAIARFAMRLVHPERELLLDIVANPEKHRPSALVLHNQANFAKPPKM